MRMLRAIFAASERPHRRGASSCSICSLAVLGALGLTPHDPLQQFRIDRLQAPERRPTGWAPTCSAATSLSRLMLGIGQSFIVAFSSVALATLAGTVIGLFAAWWGTLLGRRR